MRKYISEFIGTMVLVLFGCGVAVVSGGNLVATALAFGLAIVACAYAIGGISGCHVNPAVSLAMLIRGDIDLVDFCFYVISQVLGALAGAGILYLILSGTDLGTAALGTNGFGELSSTNISIFGALAVEIVLTFIFTTTILGVTDKKENGHVTGIVIGLTLVLVHLFGLPFTGTSVNPARSLATALADVIFYERGNADAIALIWVFIVGPLLGAVAAAYLYKFLHSEKGVEVVNSTPTEKVAEPTKKEVAPKTTKSKK